MASGLNGVRGIVGVLRGGDVHEVSLKEVAEVGETGGVDLLGTALDLVVVVVEAGDLGIRELGDVPEGTSDTATHILFFKEGGKLGLELLQREEGKREEGKREREGNRREQLTRTFMPFLSPSLRARKCSARTMDSLKVSPWNLWAKWKLSPQPYS